MQAFKEEQLQQADKSQKARVKAVSLYPCETWLAVEERIFIAESRLPRNKNQRQVLNKELDQARLLTARGSTVYLLPEIMDPANLGIKYPDAVVDGFVMEFKTITGSIHQVEERFKDSRKKADRVFLKIDADVSRHEVSRKLAGIIARKAYSGGYIIAYFSKAQEWFRWNIDDLK